MAAFYVQCRGSGNSVKRLGGSNTGAETIAAGWSGAVRVSVFKRDELDWCRVTLGQWQGSGTYPAVVLYEGPLAAYEPDPDCACGIAERHEVTA